MTSFGQIDRGQVDRIRQVISDLMQRRQAVMQARAQADREGLQLKMQLVQDEQTNRLLDAYRKVMSSDMPAEQKIQNASGITGLMSRVNPQVANSMNQGLEREIQGENLGLRKAEIGATEAYRASGEKYRELMAENQQTRNQISLQGQQETQRYHRFQEQKPDIEAYNNNVLKLGDLDTRNNALQWDAANQAQSSKTYAANLGQSLEYLNAIEQHGKAIGYNTDWVNQRRQDIQKRLQLLNAPPPGNAASPKVAPTSATGASAPGDTLNVKFDANGNPVFE
jgi:hypothetical protein